LRTGVVLTEVLGYDDRIGLQNGSFQPANLAHRVLATQTALVQSPPDSADWTREADRRGISTILLSLARFGGLESIPLKPPRVALRKPNRRKAAQRNHRHPNDARVSEPSVDG
jgi:hypothetical protein